MNRNIVSVALISLVFIILLSSCGSQRIKVSDNYYPKREFRGAWISTAWQSRYKQMNSTQMKVYFVKILDQMQADGINAVIFQARPYADAFYKSSLEPWSAFLTGTQGVAPDNGFDPLTFITEECHKRNMELHAWLNPYRVTSGEGEALAESHIYFKHPERFVKYGEQIYFDPGIPENRKFICDIVKDIVMRYDVDAIHMDDYFYPYPIAGKQFPDDKSFNTYALGQGFSKEERADWRRNNVNMLVKEIRETLDHTRPWVRFGISPFGIYRNERKNVKGSKTNGLQNYDDLYADVTLWAKKKWIDYNMPQVYWEIGHSKADYSTLVEWWAKNNHKQPLYIGQDVKRTMNVEPQWGKDELKDKMNLARSFKNIQGNCFWPAYEILDNYKGVEQQLRSKYHRYPALIPAYKNMHKKSPNKVVDLKEAYTANSHTLTWQSDMNKYDPETAQYFVVYRFPRGEGININKPEYIVTITKQNSYELPYEGGKSEYRYVITAVDGFHNESGGKTIKVSL